MDTTMDERDKFNHVISLKSASEDVFLNSGSLAMEVIEHVMLFLQLDGYDVKI